MQTTPDLRQVFVDSTRAIPEHAERTRKLCPRQPGAS
jgi:hypothetical protein